ncbi:MAG: NADP-dependent phosphogluconate dehydrogenase [Candidatus Roizmanbacteria bacterium]
MIIHYIGLGKMGKNMVLRLLEKGYSVHAWNRSPEPRSEVKKSGAKVYETVQDLLALRSKSPASTKKGDRHTPRVVWLMLPAGEPTQSMIDQVGPLLSSGDIVIDGGNGFYKDSVRYADQLRTYGVSYIDVGVSGGPSGARTGACLMIGGTTDIQSYLEPLFKDIASGGSAYQFFEGYGAGQFVKMIHNGIEYGMMQAIAEGFTLLKESDYHLDLIQVAEIYQKRSVIESRLVQWTLDGLKQYGTSLAEISGSIGHLGEGMWTVNTAKEMKIPVPIIEGSMNYRLESVKRPSYTGKLVSLMRTMFGGHSVKVQS